MLAIICRNKNVCSYDKVGRKVMSTAAKVQPVLQPGRTDGFSRGGIHKVSPKLTGRKFLCKVH